MTFNDLKMNLEPRNWTYELHILTPKDRNNICNIKVPNKIVVKGKKDIDAYIRFIVNNRFSKEHKLLSYKRFSQIVY